MSGWGRFLGGWYHGGIGPRHPSNAPELELKGVTFSLTAWSNQSPGALKLPSSFYPFLWRPPTLLTPWLGGFNNQLVSLSSESPPPVHLARCH